MGDRVCTLGGRCGLRWSVCMQSSPTEGILTFLNCVAILLSLVGDWPASPGGLQASQLLPCSAQKAKNVWRWARMSAHWHVRIYRCMLRGHARLAALCLSFAITVLLTARGFVQVNFACESMHKGACRRLQADFEDWLASMEQ